MGKLKAALRRARYWLSPHYELTEAAQVPCGLVVWVWGRYYKNGLYLDGWHAPDVHYQDRRVANAQGLFQPRTIIRWTGRPSHAMKPVNFSAKVRHFFWRRTPGGKRVLYNAPPEDFKQRQDIKRGRRLERWAGNKPPIHDHRSSKWP